MNRRTFLKIAGMGSIALTTGCTSHPEKTLYTLVEAPDDMVPGMAMWYASTCRECPAGCGIIAKNREGRIIKLEGNPDHPINQGKLCIRGQATLQGLYDPDRLKQPLLKEKNSFSPISFQEAEALLSKKIKAASAQGANQIRMVTEVTGNTLNDLLNNCLKKWNSSELITYEPYAYEALKDAHETAFGVAALPSYHMDQADFLVSFGADFLETWLSPVEYARKFKQMHTLNHGEKGWFYHIGSYQSLTGANADRSFACHPDTETAIVLGLINYAFANGRGQHLSSELHQSLAAVSIKYPAKTVADISGMLQADFVHLAQALLKAEKPLILGLSSASYGPDASATELAVLLLNLILDPDLSLYNFSSTHRIETAAKRSEVEAFFRSAAKEKTKVLLLYNTNPAYNLSPNVVKNIRSEENKEAFIVSFAASMDETAMLADLVFPTANFLESWDEYGGKDGLTSTLQPAMGRLFNAPCMGDLCLNLAFPEQAEKGGYLRYLANQLLSGQAAAKSNTWLRMIQTGGDFKTKPSEKNRKTPQISDHLPNAIAKIFATPVKAPDDELTFIAAPSIRFFDGRSANKSWLAEIPDTTTQIAWQSVALIHPDTLFKKGLLAGSEVSIATAHGKMTAAVYPDPGVHPQAVVMSIGQGHTAYGRFAQNQGRSPLDLLSKTANLPAGHPVLMAEVTAFDPTGNQRKVAHMDGSPYAHGRKIALTVSLEELASQEKVKPGLNMQEFPLTLPLPSGYDPKRDIYPPHDHDTYRWGMVVDLDRCIGCGACAAACYAENNIGVTGEKQILMGREMSWLRIERYRDPNQPERMTFLPMLCQHCDDAPCESVCPVYAPHHNKEGINNQIYNRCIGTRFCAQNCPYKVRRFNWFTWQWPDPYPLQLNPNVTVRSKGVMEKCSFCIQRIKTAHGKAKNENRLIRDGEVIPACVQTCPTSALTFGSLMDQKSRVLKLTADRRAYQVMGYLNTKPAVIYLKKVVEINDDPRPGSQTLPS
jgi:anaerobic selenocysteine-containing dehydrogenase/Fe-S-cluster-containing dehydrogenase component